MNDKKIDVRIESDHKMKRYQHRIVFLTDIAFAKQPSTLNKKKSDAIRHFYSRAATID